MEFDLNVQNYTLRDLQRFFGLNDDFDISAVKRKQSEIKNAISNSNSYEERNKPQILYFLDEAGKKLIQGLVIMSQGGRTLNDDNVTSQQHNTNFENEQMNPKLFPETQRRENLTTSTNLNDFGNWGINNAGTIDPRSAHHQSLQTQSIFEKNISGYGKQSQIHNYVFNTQLRDNYFRSTPSDCQFTLPLKINNVISIGLSALQFPNVMLAYSKNRLTNQIYLKEDTTNLEAFIIIPDGNYEVADFCAMLQAEIASQMTSGIIRFEVSYDPNTFSTIISNTTYTFTMEIYKKKIDPFDYSCENDEHLAVIYHTPDKEEADPKNPNIAPSSLFNSMGYLMGFRNPTYSGKMEYVSESIFTSRFTDYIYFVLKDYTTGTKTSTNTYCVIPIYVISDDILAVVPITNSAPFTTVFANSGDYIYKTRNYMGPVTISKIGVQILNQYGEVIDLRRTDFAFSLQVKTIYNNNPVSNTSAFNYDLNSQMV